MIYAMELEQMENCLKDTHPFSKYILFSIDIVYNYCYYEFIVGRKTVTHNQTKGG